MLRIEVTDDGAGGADPPRGTGLRGVERRLGYIRRRAGGQQPAGRADHRGDRGAVRVVIAEDLFLLREGLASLLKEHGFEVAEAVGDGPSLLAALTEPAARTWRSSTSGCRRPITDEGLRAALEARRQVPGLPVLILSAHVEQLYARELLADRAGGVGYLLKDRVFTDEQFTEALRTVARGGTVMDPEVVAKLLAKRPEPPTNDPAHRAGARGPRADGRGQVEQRHRPAPVHHREGGQQALHVHLRQAGPAA